MTDTSLRVAVVGAGYFAQFHHHAWTRLSRTELVAVCDLDALKAKSAADQAGARGFSDLGEMLDAVKPDLVDIATPPETHDALVRQVAARGLPVICQKPLAPTYDEAVAVVEAAEAAGVTLAVHENFRFQPWFRETRRLIDAGRLGTLHGITFRMRPGDGQGRDAYLNRQPYFQKMPRFLIHETGIHFIDTFRYLMGEIRSVSADLRRLNPVIAGEDAGTVVFRFDGETSGLFDANRLNDHVAENTRLTMGEMWLEGSAGVLRLDGQGRLSFKPHGGPEAGYAYAWDEKGFAGDCVHGLNRHLVAHLTRGAALENTGAAYLRNMEIVEAIYRSHETGRRIALDAPLDTS